VKRYPEILLPRQAYTILKNDDVKDNALVRETNVFKRPDFEKN
jgi:hypothetical protein